MGYTTEFKGGLNITPAPTEELKNYIEAFNKTRHMKYNITAIKETDKEWNKKGYLFTDNLGENCEYYVPADWGDLDNYNITIANVISYNDTPEGIPGLWCKWIINENNELAWDGREKFYNYIDWLNWLIKNIFAPNNYTLNGKIDWQGEEFGDVGTIIVEDNKIFIEYPEDESSKEEYVEGLY